MCVSPLLPSFANVPKPSAGIWIPLLSLRLGPVTAGDAMVGDCTAGGEADICLVLDSIWCIGFCCKVQVQVTVSVCRALRHQLLLYQCEKLRRVQSFHKVFPEMSPSVVPVSQQ